MDAIDIDTLVPDPKVREELGGISPMAMWRWERDPNLDFPPAVYVRGRKFRSRHQLETFKANLLKLAAANRTQRGKKLVAKKSKGRAA
jgi:hypothetical protein